MRREAHQHSCVGTGFIVLDVIRNSVGTVATEKCFAGGSCGNVLTILSYFGWAANAVGRIGDDHPGRELLVDLEKWGVHTELLQIESGRGTPIVVQENYLDTQGRPRHRFSRVCPVCGARLPGYRPILSSQAATIAAKLPSHSVFYFDRVAPSTLEIAQKSRTDGALVVFEPSGIKDKRLFMGCLKAAHIVKYADDRIRGIHNVVAKAKVPIEIETQGAKGLRLRIRTSGRVGVWKNLPGFSTPELCDAAGSGDWCTAGLIHELMTGGTPVEHVIKDQATVELAIKKGQALATLNCGFEGARGLMYAADAKHVLDLAASVTIGTEALNVKTISASKRVGKQHSSNICSSCMGS
jgi:fructokinase